MRALLVDGDGRCRSKLDQWIRPLGFDPATQAEDLETALKVLEKRDFDLVITALDLPGGSGMDVLQASRSKQIKTLVMSGHFETKIVTSILRVRGNELLEKPLEKGACQRAVEQLFGGDSAPQPDAEKSALLAPGEPLIPTRLASLPAGPNEVVGRCSALQLLMDSLLKVAETDAEVLILGESGTGKELIARAVHVSSHRAHRPFVAVNAAAVPETLLESELFGHTRGAFTGAQSKRKGLIAAAEGGTLFLDEIGEMPMGQQAKLLRVLQEKRFTPVGSDQDIEADVRIVAATNANLLQLVDDKKFRVDLYYRLNVFPLHLPPLRARGDDILLLADHFVGLANAKHRRAVTGIDDGLRDLLRSYHWPGNVRQLENAVDRLVIETAEGELTLDSLPADLRASLEATPSPPKPAQTEGDAERLVRLLGKVLSDGGGASAPTPVMPMSLQHFVTQAQLPPEGVEIKPLLQGLENRLIDQALERCGDNRNQAAQLLGLKRTTLVEKLRKREKDL
ncbi:MAG: hypothetical protein CMH55_01215 [Myxococcales bacterium]|nr:hypothetical protein [Myxococcales bacterium]